jgi:hypothetical protein
MATLGIGFRDFSGLFLSSPRPGADTPHVVRARPSTTVLRVVAVSALLLTLGAVVWLLPLTRQLTPLPALPASTRLTWWSLALLAGACEIVVLHIQVRRESQGISLSEIATVIGLFYATPGDFVIGRAVGTALALAFWRRQAITKMLFNCALFFAESTVALLIFHAVRGSDRAIDPRAWLAAITATVGVSLISAVAVTSVIALVDGELHRRDFLI